MEIGLNPKDRNIVLIGMCGVGKSTVGVILAKMMSRYFLDSDVFIQAIQDRDLQQIIDTEGLEAFCKIEEEYVTCIDFKNAVIATGGSVVHSPRANRRRSNNSALYSVKSTPQKPRIRQNMLDFCP